MKWDGKNERLEWTEEYNIDNQKMDEEHKKLFEIASKANNVNKISNPKEKEEYLRTVCMELYREIRKHFNNEEEYMKFHHYPNTQAHQVFHETLLDKINFIMVNINITGTSTAHHKLYYFMQKIYLEHVLKEDIKISQFISNKRE